ncbi:MAG: hypothetical protein LBT99_03280 [Bifidobacteriaceae bacterium]|jgi:hypothetical protein|nr:hypothetical protein [Bifidobacteriaceae bacterium]
MKILTEIPNPSPKAPPGLEGPIGTLFSWIKYGVLTILGVLGTIGLINLVHAIRSKDKENKWDHAFGQIVAPIAGAVLLGAIAGILNYFGY